MRHILVLLTFISFECFGNAGHQQSARVEIPQQRNLAAATGEPLVGGQVYRLAKGEYQASRLKSDLRKVVRTGNSIPFDVVLKTLAGEIKKIAIGQGSSLYTTSFPLQMSSLPNYLERSTLRDKRSRDLWILIQFRDGSRINLYSDLDPSQIESLYQSAEKRTSKVNGFRVSRLRTTDRLRELLGSKPISATRARAVGGQVFFAEFSVAP